MIILDISMPGMSGLTFLKKISDASGNPRYPVLIFTARANLEPFFSTMNVDGFLTKTSDPALLISEVRRILQKNLKSQAPVSTTKKKGVIILEDDLVLKKRLEVSFIAAGYDAIAISDTLALADTIRKHPPSIILLKTILSGTTGNAIAAALVDLPEATGIPVVLFDGSGVHKQGDKFMNVDRFVPSNNPADLLKIVAGMIG